MVGTERMTFIDLFAGAGGFSLGLHQAGMSGVLAVERDPMAFETLYHNLIRNKQAFDWPDWLPIVPMDIRILLDRYRDELSKLSGKVDIVVGGPPCQGFSLAGRRIEHDERNQMFREYLKFIEIVRPSMVMFENVPGFAMPFKRGAKPFRSYASILGDDLTGIGYRNPESGIFNFSDYGVPQNRKRFIMLAADNGTDPARAIEMIRSATKARVTAREAISDLLRCHGEVACSGSVRFKSGVYGIPDSGYQVEMRRGANNDIPDSHRFARHGSTVTERFRKVLAAAQMNAMGNPVSMTYFGTMKRNLTAIYPEKPSPTLTTLPDDHIHYEEPRILTVREYARLQSFPDWYEFKGKYTTGGEMRSRETPRYTQVANAVPPRFSRIAADTISSFL